jgi:hypothetical protein
LSYEGLCQGPHSTLYSYDASASVLSGTLTAAAQQPSTAISAAPNPVIIEWVYRTKYGYKDEWWKIFKKYRLAILERQKQLGYVKEYAVYAPSLHTSEDSRWDYRIIIVRSSQDAFHSVCIGGHRIRRP